MWSTNSKGALGASARSKDAGTTAGSRTIGKPTEHPNIMPQFWSGWHILRHRHRNVARNANHLPGRCGGRKQPSSEHPTTTTSDTHLNSRLYATHDTWWRYQVTQPPSPHNKLHHELFPYNSSVILHMQSSTMTPATYSSTATSSSIQNIRTHRVTLSGRKSEG